MSAQSFFSSFCHFYHFQPLPLCTLPHAAARKLALLEEFKGGIFDHRPQSPEIAPSDYHLFPELNTFLVDQSLRGDQETNEVVQNWLEHLAATFFYQDIQNLVPRYVKGRNLRGDCVGK